MLADRYANLFQAMDTLAFRNAPPPLHFMEIGTYDGVRAAQLIRYWSHGWHQGRGQVCYYGFDLWELLTPVMSKAELSKTKLPPKEKEVRRRLEETGASVSLFKGNTKTTLAVAAATLPKMDLIFQDGGHSLPTVESDWLHARTLMGPETIYLFDDYYLNRNDYGCQALVERLRRDSSYEVKILEPVDTYSHTDLSICMVKVTLAPFNAPDAT